MANLDWAQCDAVESIPGKVSGAWVLRGTRMPVSAIFENIAAGASLDDIMEWFDGLDRDQVKAVIDFAARSLDKEPSYAPYLKGHVVRTAAQQGWDRLRNGDLIGAAEAAGFNMLLTTDRNMRYQQSLAGKKIAVLVLSRQQWGQLRPHVQLVVDAVNAAAPGSFAEVEIPVE
jgi:uncharacterized protein (DUF433 family)